tara:strand:+ start:1267 stop:1413 length:147 start_codon:yes stop_codon:yes gene_type:complete
MTNQNINSETLENQYLNYLLETRNYFYNKGDYKTTDKITKQIEALINI